MFAFVSECNNLDVQPASPSSAAKHDASLAASPKDLSIDDKIHRRTLYRRHHAPLRKKHKRRLDKQSLFGSHKRPFIVSSLYPIDERPEIKWVREQKNSRKRENKALRQREQRHRQAFPLPWLQVNKKTRTQTRLESHLVGTIHPETRDASIVCDCLCSLWRSRYVDETMPEGNYTPLFKEEEEKTDLERKRDENRLQYKIEKLREKFSELEHQEKTKLSQQAGFGSIYTRSRRHPRRSRPQREETPPSPKPQSPKVLPPETKAPKKKKKNKILNFFSGVRKIKEAYDTFEGAKTKLAYTGSSPDNVMGNLMARVEDILTLVLGLMNAQNLASFFVAIQGYLRSLYQESISGKIFEWIKDALVEGAERFKLPTNLNFGLDKQSMFDTLRGVDVPGGIDNLRTVISQWRKHKSNPMAKNLANVINILVTLGFCPHLQDNPVKLGPFELFRAKVWDCQKDSWDFADMAINTFDFFLERGYHALKTGDISLLLSGDAAEIAYEKEYTTLMSCMPALEAQRIQDLSKYGVDILDESDFDFRLQTIIKKTLDMLNMEKAPPRKKVLGDYLLNLRKLSVQLVISQKTSCLREKPFGLLIYGKSSVGKSAVVNCLMKSLLAANGFANKKENVVTIKDNENFDVDQEPFHTGWIYDDYGNTRAEHYSEAPTRMIIDVLNNIPRSLRKPDLESKGNKMMNPKIVGVTTNIKELHANKFSVEPVSIIRRFEVVLDVKVRPEYQKDTGGLDGSKLNSWLPDAWQIDIQRVMIDRVSENEQEGEHTPDKYHFETVQYDASIEDVLSYCKKLSEAHFKSQKRFVANVESMYEREFCRCGFPKDECWDCMSCKSEPSILFRREDSEDDPSLPDLAGHDEDSDDEEHLSKQALFKCNHQDFGLQDDWYDAEQDDDDWAADSIEMKPTRLGHFVDNWNSVMRRNDAFVRKTPEYSAENLEEATELYKNMILQETLKFLCITAAVYATFQMLKKSRVLFQPIEAQSAAERPPEVLPTDQPNPWKKVCPTAIPKSTHSSNITYDDLLRMTREAMAFAKVYAWVDGERYMAPCNAVPLTGNEWVFPRHVMEQYDEVEIHLSRVPEDCVGFKAIQKIDRSNWVDIGNDLALVRIKAGGSQKELCKYLPEGDWELTSQLFCGFSSFNENLQMTKDSVRLIEKKEFDHGDTFTGFSYTSPCATFVGQCGSPMVTFQRRPCLLGFHIAGRTGTNYGVSACITRQDFEVAHSKLMSKDPLTCHSEGTFVTTKFGIDYTPTDDISPKHPINFLENDEEGQAPTCVTYGSHPQGTVKFISQVKKSPISDIVADVLEIPRIHGAPQKGRSWRHWQRDLTQMAHPKGGTMRPKFLQAAYDDLLRKFRKHVSDSGKQNLIHPYPKEVILSGMDGISSVDKVDLLTSMGWPLNKSKKWFLQESEDKYPGITQLIEFMKDSPIQWSDIEEMENELAEGRRVHVVFRGNLKDEPTKFTKDKIRVFAGCEFGFTCLVRKYFLPLVRLIQNSEGKLECSVGVNATSPQWTKMAKILTRFGTKRMIAGDYKAYDKNISIQMMQFAFEILIQLAEDAGYDERQLTIMRGIATEISQPMYEYDGVFIQMFGSNPSGHPLTVIINNIVNSLYLRYAYYSMHEHDENVPDFDKVISLLCYGDDNAAGVSEEETKFNHTTLAKELAKIGITYTMADKEAESVPFIDFKDVTFLKRWFRWCEETQNYKAPIEEASIAKSLHNYMKRKGSDVLPEEIAAQVIRGANFEFYHHGKQVFERRRAQLHEVADIAGIRRMVGDLDVYEDLESRYLDAGWKRNMLDEPNIPMLLSGEEFSSRED